MKLNCGPDATTKYYRKKRRLEQWHPFFCWFPRRITGTEECRWLETIERKGEYHIHYAGAYWEWVYRVRDLTDFT